MNLSRVEVRRAACSANRRFVRWIAAAAMGGVVLQFGACAQIVAPSLLAFGEQILFATILNQVPL